MTLETLLATCQKKGITLRFEHDALKAFGEPSVLSEMLPAIKQHKEELKRTIKEEWQYRFQERIGIIQEDTYNSLSSVAERLGYVETFFEYVNTCHPDIVPTFNNVIRR